INQLDSNYFSMHAFTQDFVRAKLNRDLGFKEAAQARWINWYVNFLSPFSEDWLDWQNYDALDAEWGNVRSLVNGCLESKSYTTFLTLWQGLRGYSLFRGYWDERQEWMDTLATMARQRNDSAVLTQAMFYQGQTLVHLDEADTRGGALQLLEEAWGLGPHIDPDIQFGILVYIAAIYLKRQQFDVAKSWLDKKEDIINPSNFSRDRQQCAYDYYVAAISMGRKNYESAEASYRKALKLAESTHWEKQTVYIKGELVKLLLQTGALDEAEALLSIVLKAVKHHKDKRAIARSYYDLALLAEQRSQTDAFRHWANLAEQEFRKLRMTVAANKIQQWLLSK
ncbi:MAG: hypothetical protein AAFY72_10295, partial [Cyanobacteria bacterium J06649_4]